MPKRKVDPQLQLELYGGHYLYKIVYPETGHFYFGATSDWEKRKGGHMNKIITFIKEMRWHEQDHAKKKIKPPFKSSKPALKVNMFLAEQIKPLVKRIIVPGSIVERYYTFKVMARSTVAADIKKIEDDELKKHKDNPLCLNCAFYSSYNDSRYAKTKKRIDDVYNMYFKNGVRI